MTAPLKELRAVRKLVAGAKVGDCDLDLRVLNAIKPGSAVNYAGLGIGFRVFDFTTRRWRSMPHPTTDLRDTVDLVRRTMPGAEWGLRCFVSGRVVAHVGISFSLAAKTMQLALVAALLTALIDSHEAHHGREDA